MSMWLMQLWEAVLLVLSGWELVSPAAAVALRRCGRGLISPFPAYSSKHHFEKSTREYPAHPGHGFTSFQVHSIMEDVGSPVIKGWGQSSFWQMFSMYTPMCCICHTLFGCLKWGDGRENATSVENCWHLNYLPAGTGSNFPARDIKMGSALKEQFSTIWKCCHYIHNWSSVSSDTAWEAADRKYLGHRSAEISVWFQ